ncbi:MAG: hypothetical protein C4288_20820 [Leptolyngbya sp. ERB_1_1]
MATDDNTNYDAHITPAETAARQAREGKNFGHISHEAEQTDDGAIHTTDGYTVDREGLLNNYAIEPEMYVNVPGDLRQQEAQLTAERAHQLHDRSKNEDGKLTTEHDLRHQEPELI